MRTTEPYRLLIVSGNRSVTDRFERLIQVFDTIELSSSVTTAQDGVITVREAKPDVVLVDVNLPDMDGIQLTEIIRRDNPDIQVIVLAKDKLGDVVLNAMRSGASDFLTYEVPLEELRLSVHRAGELAVAEKKKRGSYEQGRGTTEEEGAKDEKKGKVIAVYSPKGGTGATTLAVNLAVALHGTETTVGLVDGDLQYGDVGLLVNEVPPLSILDLVSRIYELDSAMVEDVMVLHKTSGIHILTAPPRPEFAEKVSEAHFSIILDNLRQIFDYHQYQCIHH
jgi:pilus assembly protein CpaE